MSDVVGLPQKVEPILPEARTIALQMVVAGLLICLRGKGVLSREDVTAMLQMVENGVMQGVGELRATYPEGAATHAAACRAVLDAMFKTIHIEP